MQTSKLKPVVFLIIGVMLLSACRQSTSSSPENEGGFVQVKGGKVWYQVIGSGPKTPIVFLHGGQGRLVQPRIAGGFVHLHIQRQAGGTDAHARRVDHPSRAYPSEHGGDAWA